MRTVGRRSELGRLLAEANVARAGSRREAGEQRPLGRKAARTRAALLQAAFDEFVRAGYRSTSVQDIHEAAGVSIGTFYQYFRDKSELMLTLVAEAIIDAAGTIFPPLHLDSPDAGARAVVEGFVRNYVATADFQRVWEEATYHDERVATFRWRAVRAIEGSLRDAVAAGQASGLFDADLDPQTAARALTAMVDRFCYETFVVEGRRDEVTVAATIDRLAALWAKVLTGRAAP